MAMLASITEAGKSHTGGYLRPFIVIPAKVGIHCQALTGISRALPGYNSREFVMDAGSGAGMTITRVCFES